MRKIQRNERVVFVTAGIILFSMLLMLITIPSLFNDTSLTSTPGSATIGISLAIIIRLIILFAYRKIIRNNKGGSKKRDKGYLGIGILLILFGAFYADGALAFLTQDDVPVVSILMFTSILCDLAASILMFVQFFSKPQKIEQSPGYGVNS